MKILIAGSTGLIGTTLVPRLKQSGHEIVRLVRSNSCLIEHCLQWEPSRGEIDPDQIEGFDAVISLGGVNLSQKRWTPAFMQAIIDSRVESTKLLANTIAKLNRKPKVWLSASAVGYYGLNLSTDVDETAPLGDGFLAEVCSKWEAACDPAAEAGVRVVKMRIGAVLSTEGGVLGKILPIFKLGLGGKLGSGQQIMSWIELEDLVRGMIHLLKSGALSGPVNMTSPNPISNAQFTRSLAGLLKRPAFFTVPAFALKLAMGEMGTNLALSSVSATPTKLLQSGFEFQTPTIDQALAKLIPR